MLDDPGPHVNGPEAGHRVGDDIAGFCVKDRPLTCLVRCAHIKGYADYSVTNAEDHKLAFTLHSQVDRILKGGLSTSRPSKALQKAPTCSGNFTPRRASDSCITPRAARAESL